MSPKRLAALLPAAAVLVFSGIPAAQPAPSATPRADAREQRREDRRERREDRRDKRDESREQRNEERKGDAADRRDRRHERLAKLRARWGALLRHPAVLAELRLHGRRMARLQTLRRIAEREGKTALLPRIDKLVEKEQARHERHMAGLKSRGSAAPTASASSGGGQ
jgi:hypothetical protein